jgi:inorganic phosphate transporter, PiT family
MATATPSASYSTRNFPFSRQDRHADFRRRAGHRSRLRRLQPAARSFHRTQRIDPALCASGLALLVALGFEFVNGFHDTANAVATVIYTHSLEPHIAVVWSGFWNFLGVLASSGLVAFAIVSPTARRTDSAGRQLGRIRHGLRLAGRRHHLEPGHLVVRPARVQFAHADRFRHRSRHRQPAHVGKTGTSGVDWGQAANIG